MNIIDTSSELLACFSSDGFRYEKWQAYIDKAVPGAGELCVSDMRECIAAGYSWEHDFLPVLNAVIRDAAKREEAISSFHLVADGLNERISGRFGRTVDADVILYLGLCSGAGWVTPVNGKTTVLLGIEKIMELNWCDTDSMTGLIVHELGHVYQAQYGVLHRHFNAGPDKFLWQLFTEGVAMVFEQEAAGNGEYYHQYDAEWKLWCDEHAELIRDSFIRDLPAMTNENQRYFGDWVEFCGRGDTGYYLGARFVRFLMRRADFDSIINYGPEEVKRGFEGFMRERL